MLKNFLKGIKYKKLNPNQLLDHFRVPLTIILCVVITFLTSKLYFEKNLTTGCVKDEAWQATQQELRAKLAESEKQKSELSVLVAQPKTENSNENSSNQPIGIININSANLSQLDSLPGIGPVYAQRIIDYRESHGGFKRLEELKNIKGIGDVTFAKLKDLVSI